METDDPLLDLRCGARIRGLLRTQLYPHADERRRRNAGAELGTASLGFNLSNT